MPRCSTGGALLRILRECICACARVVPGELRFFQSRLSSWYPFRLEAPKCSTEMTHSSWWASQRPKQRRKTEEMHYWTFCRHLGLWALQQGGQLPLGFAKEGVWFGKSKMKKIYFKFRFFLSLMASPTSKPQCCRRHYPLSREKGTSLLQVLLTGVQEAEISEKCWAGMEKNRVWIPVLPPYHWATSACHSASRNLISKVLVLLLPTAL